MSKMTTPAQRQLASIVAAACPHFRKDMPEFVPAEEYHGDYSPGVRIRRTSSQRFWRYVSIGVELTPIDRKAAVGRVRK